MSDSRQSLIVVISGNEGETREFCRVTGITRRRVLHAAGPHSLAKIRCDFDLLRVGNWRDRPYLREIELTLAWKKTKYAKNLVMEDEQ